jgi:hypothetical protein
MLYKQESKIINEALKDKQFRTNKDEHVNVQQAPADHSQTKRNQTSIDKD